MWENIATKTFTPLGQEPFPGFYTRIQAACVALADTFIKAQWNVYKRTIPNRPLIFGISYEHGALIVPCEELNDQQKEEYLTILEQVLNYYTDIVPFVAPWYKRNKTIV